MLLKLALLLGGICAISAEIVEIGCSVSGVYCLVDELTEGPPANATWKFLCPQDCTQIRMMYTNLPRFPRELWITHQQVTYLSLYLTDFEELEFGDFFNAAKLTTLQLRNNQKSLSLRDNCFWGAFGLTSLEIYGSKVNEMEGGAFNGIPLLERLQMENNEISYISNDHFRNLPNLHSLYLYFNTIGTVESEAFLHNTNLDFLSFNANSLTEVDLLLPFLNTGTISIFGNQLTKVAYRSISPDFEEIENGTVLYLEKNELTTLYIQPNFAVEQLILWENPIQRIDTLPMLKSLKVLNLQRCDINSLDGQRFADKYVNLRTLHLSGNNMTSFSKETFAGLEKLETLTLNTNELTGVDFPRLESLTSLEVSSNSLTEFHHGKDIRDTFPALKDLDIRNNDFDEEYLAELVKTLEDHGITVRWKY